ncbi:MAG: hypothetical protein ACWGQW_19710, partial [bacterium]
MLFDIKIKLVFLLIHSFQPLKELGVHEDIIILFGEKRRDFFRNLLEQFIGVGRRQIAEDRVYGFQQFPTFLECRHGVFERRLLLLLQDKFNFRLLLTDALLEGREVVFFLDFAEGWNPKRSIEP